MSLRVIARAALNLALAITAVGCASLASTSSRPEHRSHELGEPRCATTLKRAQNFVKYWPPGPERINNIAMFNPKWMGFRGYDLLGDLYYQGCRSAGLAPDKRLAAAWYENAALGHVPESQFKLGRMLTLGDGVPQNEELGIAWLMSAALEGDQDARTFLANREIAAPPAVTPSTYSQLEQWAAIERAAGRQELLRTTVQLVTYAAALYATAHVQASQATATAQTVTRIRPTYCQTYGTAVGSSYGSTAWVNVTASTFCN